LPASEAAFQAANLLTSGPAGGVLASQKLGEQLGYRNILTTDMGGTSFDVGIIVNGEPVLERMRQVGRFHVALPSIKVTAIGAGGGSIARVRDGHLTVGPDSAGAVPGPACFGRGGSEPTITDADVVLGILDPDYFLGGQMPLDAGKAAAAIEERIARPLKLTLHEAAAGIREVANNQMADLLRRVTTRSGYDPRDFVLFAYGGAGPTHACQYAAFAGIATVIAPTTASGQSAFGAVTADRHRSFSLAFGQHAPARFTKASAHVSSEKLNEGFKRLEQQCLDALGREARIKRHIGMRFRQQVHEVEVEVAPGTIDAAGVDALVDRFEQQYEALYGKGTALRGSGVEFIVLRVEGSASVAKPRPAKLPASSNGSKPCASRPVYFYGKGLAETQVYRAENLGPGVVFAGPAIVERPDTTIVVGLGQRAEVDLYGHVILHLNG
jgi:N-methylhydantoinase A